MYLWSKPSPHGLNSSRLHTESAIEVPEGLMIPATGIPDCAGMEASTCSNYNADCCLDDCMAELHQATTCVIKEGTGVDRTTCPVPSCTSTRRARFLQHSPVVSFGGVSFTTARASEDCPTEWNGFMQCLFQNCPNAVQVCPNIIAASVGGGAAP